MFVTTQNPQGLSEVISFRSVDKEFFQVSDRPETLKTLLVSFGKKRSRRSERKRFPVFKDLSFSVVKGEFLGVMGKNGAGKSTLLKLMCGIYFPTQGEITVRERVAPLIELGAGFNPELSGYENIFLNAAILGFGKKITEDAVPRILEFSELGDHIYSPVKQYSSGMLVRLGFSIATHLDAPILLVDEVLAVGDLGFQRKCLARIRELHQQNKTIILITHDPEAVRQHCGRCILIDQHRKVFDGDAGEGATLYKQLMTPS